MHSQGPLSPGTVAGDGGGQAFSSPDNVKVSDGSFASSAVDQQETDKLKCTNFGFAIPAGATITGIVVEVQRKSDQTGNVVDDAAVPELTKDGFAPSGNPRADTATQWPASEAYATYGSSADLWDTTWTVAQINASTFGVFIGGEETGVAADVAYIDHVRVTVYYTLPYVTNDGARLPNDQWHDRPVGVGDGMSVTGP